MATNIVQTEEKQHHKEDEEEQQQQHEQEEEEEEVEEEEEEALSLCDLPINLKDQPRSQEHLHDSNEEEFNFRSWGAGAPFSKEPEMCAADEVFFKGQILPLRLSFSSEAGLLATLSHSQSQKHYGNSNRSESLDCNSSDFKNSSNNSSRSSSLRSQNSSTSTSSTSTFKYATIPKIQNQFHAHPSPKPQLRSSVPTHSQRRKSTSAWGIFRLGVVPAPEIGLQDLKVRNRNSGVVSRNSSNSSSSSNSAKSVRTSNNRNKNNHNHKGSNHNVLKQLVGKGGGLLSGCDCSIETVQPKNMIMIKGGGSGKSGGAKSRNMTESTTHAAKEKVVGELKNKQKKKQQKQGKKVTSRRRTFEWIKELHATQPEDEEALLSNA